MSSLGPVPAGHSEVIAGQRGGRILDFKSRVLKRHPDAAFQEVDGMAMVVVTSRSEVQVLNPVGSRVWSLIDGQRSVAEILEEILAEYDVDPADLERDVREFVDTLDQHDMLEREEEK